MKSGKRTKPRWLRKIDRDLKRDYGCYVNLLTFWHSILDHGYVEGGYLVGEPYSVGMETLEQFTEFCKRYGLTFSINPNGVHGADVGIRTLHITIWKEGQI